MTRSLAETREILVLHLRHAEDQINSAYWRFTRMKRGKPPAEQLYYRRNALRDAIRRVDELIKERAA